MSASAGKVMPRPMGDYNALTEYKILDIVTYNDRPYMAKQTTTGNLPTNTTYWMLLLDFPTEVDNVPTQNSNNLVKSGGVYSATADKMKVDGSNANDVVIGGSTYTTTSFARPDIAKDAGDNQTVTLTQTLTNEGYAKKTETILKSHIGDDTVYYKDSSNNFIYIVIDSVTRSTATVTATAHLKVDDSAAISESSKYLYLKSYIKSNQTLSLVVGKGNAVNGSDSSALGTELTVNGDSAHAEGYRNAVAANYGHAEGTGTYAGNAAHSEGNGTMATGDNSHAEGYQCVASGEQSHAEGYATTASGSDSHAEGYNTVASGAYSHAAGRNTVAGYGFQNVIGFYNDNKEYTQFEIGAGSSNNRSNCFEVYGDGSISLNNGVDRFKLGYVGGKYGFYHASGPTGQLGSFIPFELPIYLVNNSVTLSTSQDTTVTFSNAAITSDSMIDVYTDNYSIVPKNVVATTGSVTVTFEKVASATTIKVKVEVKN